MTELEPPHSKAPVVAAHSDFFQGDVEAGLEKMRRRLLDLTKRNRLLNYRYSKKGSLRVVDELPNQLFQLLVDGKELSFKAVSRPTEWRRRPLDSDAWSGVQLPTAAEHAASLGIRTSFDLPHPGELGGEIDPSHRDRAIQTLHYAEDLEALLRSLASTARLTIEETGTNMLYLVFGFLDWYESDDSDQAATAPLILLPVSLRRLEADSESRVYRYGVQHSGEDILANISLQELLRRDFSLDLPDFDEEDEPETYFRKLQPILAHQRRWKIRRHVTLTLLSFGKLLMYRDLDPITWPRGKSPANHERIREFFEGRESDSLDFATEYSIDAPDPPNAIPPVVDEADSSQHSALVDAVSGKNLVIAGPPGTGKSQTITNLIAAALEADKRVLFVSEKLAALEVVKHRLEKLGLGLFCLELHSHKSNKRAFLDDLDARLQARGTFADPAILGDKLRALEETKRLLNEYVTLINRPYGPQHQKLFDVIWSAARARTKMASTASMLGNERLPGAATMTLDQSDSLSRAVEQYAGHLSECIAVAGGLASHPWYGVRNADLTFQDEQELLAKLRDLCAATDSLLAAITHANELLCAAEPWLQFSIATVESAFSELSKLCAPENVLAGLLSQLSRPDARRRVVEFIGWLDNFRSIRAKIETTFGAVPRLDSAGVRRLDEELHAVSGLAPGIVKVADIQSAADTLAVAAQATRQALQALEQMEFVFGSISVVSEQTLPVLGAALETLSSCPTQHLHLRHEALEDPQSETILKKAAQEASALREARTRLEKRVDLGLEPSVVELRAHVVATANARWWSVLRADYRRARRLYRSLAKVRDKSAASMRRDYSEMLRIRNSLSAIESNASYRRCAGPHSQGIDTPYHELAVLAQWRAGMRDRLVPLGPDGEHLADAFWSAGLEKLRRGVAMAGERTPMLRIAAERLTEARQVLQPGALPGNWSDAHDVLIANAYLLRSSADKLAQIGAPTSLQLATRAQFVGALTDLGAGEARILGSREITDLLGEDFRGTSTDLAALRATVTYYDAACNSKLPEAVRRWLLLERPHERLTESQACLGDAAEMAQHVREASQLFLSTGRVNVQEWHPGMRAVDTVDLVQHRLRAGRALDSSRNLAGWLDYLHSAQKLSDSSLGFLVQLAENERLDSDELKPAFEYVRANSLVRDAFVAYPHLARFSGLSHEQVRRRYGQLDKECMALYRKKVAAKIARRHVPSGVGYGPAAAFTELNLLSREIAKQKRHIPLRQLVRRAGNALLALKPCFMMGPLSVAQYLAPGALEFDLLIVDEASQLRPQDALGSIARVKQVVIVGDQMQLPPTSFFERLDDEAENEDEEASAIEDAESILDVARSLYRPARMLKWHYRSRHGSLIAFSNKEFYDNNLVVFPPPAPKSATLGVKFVYVADGVFDSRRNVAEARRIVSTAARHMRERPTESLGIVAMNAPQRELIEELLEQQLKSDQLAEAFVGQRAGGLEPLFVKNLENVQGDERDVIYISATYGKNAQGHFHQRFGPILGQTGHRRLNVLFTRARKRVVLFSSMRADDIKVQSGSPWGLKALKGYLAYAETGNLETAQFSGREPDSDFEVDVAEALRRRGYEVVAQVGVAGYFIDLAVRHPDKNDAFILGIECDGAGYHSARSARDRDRLRQAILEDLGWNIHRVWSTDWFKQPDTETDRIVQRIEAMRRTKFDAEGEAELLDQSDDISSPVTSETWIDEVGAQPLTTGEALQQLELLRDSLLEKDASLKANDSILRSEVLEWLVRRKPRNRDEWQRSVPIDVRLATRDEHVAQYLPQILEITSRLP